MSRAMPNIMPAKLESDPADGPLPARPFPLFLIHDNSTGAGQSESVGSFFVSNELKLHATFPILERNAEPGALIAVGFDQGLDILAAVPQLDRAILMDIHRPTLLAINAVLEVGRLHLQAHGPFEQQDDLIRCFAPRNLEETMKLLEDGPLAADLEVLTATFERRFTLEGEVGPPMIYSSLVLKGANLFPSWLSSADRLNAIIAKYAEGKIQAVCSDISDVGAARAVSQNCLQAGTAVSVVYLSNVPNYLHHERKTALSARLGLEGASCHPTERIPIKGENTIFVVTNIHDDNGPARNLNLHHIIDSPHLARYFSNTWGYAVMRQRDAFLSVGYIHGSRHSYPQFQRNIEGVVCSKTLEFVPDPKSLEAPKLPGTFHLRPHQLDYLLKKGIVRALVQKDTRACLADGALNLESIENGSIGSADLEAVRKRLIGKGRDLVVRQSRTLPGMRDDFARYFDADTGIKEIKKFAEESQACSNRRRFTSFALFSTDAAGLAEFLSPSSRF